MVRHFMIGSLLLFSLSVMLCAQSATAPKSPFTAADVEAWKQLQARGREIRQNAKIGTGEPFKVLGNLYSVGVPIGNSFLLTSPQGHILLNTGYAESAEAMGKNIEALGFKMADIRILAPTHWHNDGGGGTAYFKSKTGAQVVAAAGDIPFLERGGDGSNQRIPAVKVDRALFEGDVINLGPLTVQTYSIPGHTAGSTSFSFTVREGNRDYRVFQYCCGQNIPDNVGRNPNFSEAAMRHTFETFRKILPVDVYLAGPSASFWMAERLAKTKAGDRLGFVDRSTFPAFAAWLEVEFEEKFSKSDRFKTQQ
jgi:metallo-beta-lactamase class B